MGPRRPESQSAQTAGPNRPQGHRPGPATDAGGAALSAPGGLPPAITGRHRRRGDRPVRPLPGRRPSPRPTRVGRRPHRRGPGHQRDGPAPRRTGPRRARSRGPRRPAPAGHLPTHPRPATPEGRRGRRPDRPPRRGSRLRLPPEAVWPPPPVHPDVPRGVLLPIERGGRPAPGGPGTAPTTGRTPGPEDAPEHRDRVRPAEVAPLRGRRPGADRPGLLRAVCPLRAACGIAGRGRLAGIQPSLLRPGDLPDPAAALAGPAWRGLPATPGPRRRDDAPDATRGRAGDAAGTSRSPAEP